MATTDLGLFLRGLSRQMAIQRRADLTDAQLVEQSLRGEEAALQAIVHRHGPMVYRVCWRLLHNTHDAEDAFQAAFLVLARKLPTLRKHASLASWLHGVARRVAFKLKASIVARRDHEHDPGRPVAVVLDDIPWCELRVALDEELTRLPEKWRLPLILCHLEQFTQDEAAAQLGCSKSTLRRRLEEAREALGQRLRRRGFAGAVAGSAVLLSDCLASPSADLLASAASISGAAVVGRTTDAGPKITTLAHGVLQAMTVSHAKKIAVALVALAFVSVVLGLGGSGLVATGAADPSTTEGADRVPPFATGSAAVAAPGVRPAHTSGDEGKGEKRVAFELRDESWSRILEKVTDITGLPLVSSLPPPKGKFTHMSPKGRLYSIAEVFEIVNRGLAAHKLKLVRLDKANVLTLIQLKEEPELGPGETRGQDLQRGQGATPRPIKIRVYIEKVDVESATITASCMLIGEIDSVTKPARIENLRVSEKAKIMDRGKHLQLTDLRHLPRDTHFYLYLKTYEEEFGFEVVGIETIGNSAAGK